MLDRAARRRGSTSCPQHCGSARSRGRLRIWANAHRAGARRRLDRAYSTASATSPCSTRSTRCSPTRRSCQAAARRARDVLPEAVLRGPRAARRPHRAGPRPPAGPRPRRRPARGPQGRQARPLRRRGRPPALGKPAKKFAKRMKAVQKLLGDHQDSVVARDALRDLAVQAHAAGESAFTWGLLYGQRGGRAAAARERELPGSWARGLRPRRTRGRRADRRAWAADPAVRLRVTPASSRKSPRCLSSRSSRSSKPCCRMCRSRSSTSAAS